MAGRPRSDRQPPARHPDVHRVVLRRHCPDRHAPRRRRPGTPLLRGARRSLDKRALQRAARDDAEVREALRGLPDKDVAGVRARYDGIAWAVGTTLDGTWSYEDTRAAYVPVGRPENRHQAAEVGAFLLEDILHYALARKDPERQALIVVDEFSKLSDRPGAAVDLVERARSFNVAVVLIAQTWASLGPDDTIRDRLAGTVGTVITHQLKQPDEVAALAGTEPDDIRRLHQGEAFIIHSGQALKLRIRPPRSRHRRQQDRPTESPMGRLACRGGVADHPHNREYVRIPGAQHPGNDQRTVPALGRGSPARLWSNRSRDYGRGSPAVMRPAGSDDSALDRRV
ncbi:MAG: hypothetical protein QOF96_1137 [Actinomycetota bacterium]|nr:hypothetical protein [Actinomycetota bacterium]